MKFLENNKEITIKNLDINIKKKILNYELVPKNVKKEFSILLSNDDNYLPLFDIISGKIFFYKKERIFNLMKNYNFRPLNNNLINFLNENNYDKKLINLINLFDFDILEKLLLNFTYYYSVDIGYDFTYFKNPAFYKHFDINPFLKKTVIIDTALNLGIIKTANYFDIENIEKLYNKVKGFFFTSDILTSHIKLINDSKLDSFLSFYTLYGSYFLNKYLRGNNMFYDENIVDQINILYNLISKTKKIKKEKYVFRFLYDSNHLKLRKVGDIYINDSFMSCTRKPNFDSTNNEFGYILLKIKLNPNLEGYFISIEHSSVFPKEKEILIKPGVKFKLVSIDNEVDFHLYNKKYTRNIKKKYELEVIDIGRLKIPNYPKENIYDIDIFDINIYGETIDDLFETFVNSYCEVNNSCIIRFSDNVTKKFYFNYYNSLETYSKFYYYKKLKGFYCYSFDEFNQIDIFLEFGDDIIVNYPSYYLIIRECKEIDIIVALFCYIFSIKSAKIFNFNKISSNDYSYLSNGKLNQVLFDIINNKNLNYNYKVNNYNHLLNKLDKNIDSKYLHPLIMNLIDSKITIRKLILKLFNENKYYLKYLNYSLQSEIIFTHYIFNPYKYLLRNNIISNIPINFSKSYNQNLQSRRFEN